MKTALFAAGIGTAIAFAAFAPDAAAQQITATGTCQAVGANGAPEPLGDARDMESRLFKLVVTSTQAQ
jgi:hypothetical protein